MSRASGVLTQPLVARTRPLAGPADLLEHFDPDGFSWLHGSTGIVTSGAARRVRVAPGPGGLADAVGRVEALLGEIDYDDPLGRPGTAPVAVAALPFDDGSPGEIVVPARVVGADGDGAWMTEVGPPGSSAALEPPRAVSPAGPASFAVRALGTREAWDAAVERTLSAIGRGDVEKVVLAREVEVTSDAEFDRRALVARLHADHPSTFVFAAAGWVGATPELLVRRAGRHAVSRPMAGTAPNDRAELLATSAKEAAEHRAVVDAVKGAVAPHADLVSAPEHPAVEHVPGMAHLVTTVEVELADPAASALRLAAALHPTPAVAGTPRDGALDLIRDVEGFDRGRYAGPVGWVDARGDGEWAVALRCAEIVGTRARLVAGAGVVAGSTAESEWAETQVKFAPMLAALVRV